MQKLSNYRWDIRYISDLKNLKSLFCYDCSLPGVLQKCKNCWRAFHFKCFSLGTKCHVCANQKRGKISHEDFLDEFKSLVRELESLPKIFGIQIFSIKNRKFIQYSEINDIFYFQNLFFGKPNTEILRMTNKLEDSKIALNSRKNENDKSTQTKDSIEDITKGMVFLQPSN